MKETPMLVSELTIMPIWDPVACLAGANHIGESSITKQVPISVNKLLAKKRFIWKTL